MSTATGREFQVEVPHFNVTEYFEGIPITKEWCEKLGMEIEKRYHESSNYDWIAEKGNISVKALNGEIFVRFHTGGVVTSLENVIFVHQLQNIYYIWHSKEIEV